MIGDMQRSGIQTSFIPKKPLVSYGQKDKPGISGILNFIAIIAFVVSLSVFGGAYVYKLSQERSIASIKSDLSKVKKDLESKDSLMREMIRFDTKLNTAGALLNNHVSLRKVFEYLEESTMKNLRFTDFGYTNKNNEKVEIKMSGEAGGYSTIAWQAKEFVDAKKTGDKDYTDIIFSDLNPGLTGNVVFKLTATVNPALILYSNLDSIKGSI